MSSGKKVIMVNGKNENWYDQAIFIVKNENKNPTPPTEQLALVAEAEKIMNDYYNEQKKDKKKERTKASSFQAPSLDAVLNICITLCSLFLLTCICLIVIPL